MNRQQLLDSLAYLVERYEDTGGQVGVSQAEAARLLELYDDGEIQEDDLPLSLAVAVAGRRAQLVVEAARQSTEALRELSRQVAAGEATIAAEAAEEASDVADAGSISDNAIEEAAEEIRESGILSEDPPAGGTGPSRTVDIDSRRRFTVTVMEDFDGDVFDDARNVVRGDMDAGEWHERMLDRVRRDLLQQARLGKGRPLTAGELDDLQDVMDDQAERLKRFADEIAARNELADNAEAAARRQLQETGEEVTEEAVEELAEEFRARKMTTDQVAARSRMYKGKGYEQFWRKNEEQIDDPEVVVDYVAVDDAATCTPCQGAEAGGPYLPGQGPMPGSVCLGGGHCRCQRVQRTAPQVAGQLRGE